MRRSAVVKLVVLSVMAAVVGGCAERDDAELVRGIPWALTGEWLIGDLHTHSRFSDGALAASSLVEQAGLFGCQVMALTDHSSLKDGILTASREYLNALQKLRDNFPGVLLIGGIEWNVPPYEGREHVNLLVDPSAESAVLPAFRERFDSVRPDSVGAIPDPEEALSWLSTNMPADSRAVLFYNHPSRKSDEMAHIGMDFSRWRRTNEQVIGFEGGPGHQRSSSIGSYKNGFETVDRWDPVVADVGGVWDTLLDQGEDVWAAIANSDYHNDRLDYAPCEFSRIHLQVPQRTELGVLEALEAGSFWAQHGPILDALLFAIAASGLELPATPGEAISLNKGQGITLHLGIERSVTAVPMPLTAEFISNCGNGTSEVVSEQIIALGETSVSWEMEHVQPGIDGKSCYARARVRSRVFGGPDLMAYTNPIRVFLN